MRFWVGVSAAFSAGAIIGTGLGILLVEDKLKKEYAESTASMRRAYEAARIDAETPVATEEELVTLVRHDSGGVTLEGGEVSTPGRTVLGVVGETGHVNPYHQSVVAANDQVYASYAEIEEEDYYDEDGRIKEQITMIYDDGVPRFFQESEEIDDWMERLGGTIVDDMRAAVDAGNPVIFVRNNQTGTDYEVLFDQP